MSDTPRTNKEICEFAPTADPHYEGPIEWVPAWVAKKLERELNEARAINAELEIRNYELMIIRDWVLKYGMIRKISSGARDFDYLPITEEVLSNNCSNKP